MKDILTALSPFVATAVATGAAWLALQNNGLAIAILTVAAIVIVFFSAAFEIGASRLPGDPVNAVKLMNLSAGAHWVTAALGSTVVIVAGVKLLAGDELTGSEKELLGAFGGGVTAFITAVSGAFSGEKAEEKLGSRTKSSFQSKYTRPESSGVRRDGVHYFAPSSTGERWVHAEHFQGASGWDKSSRNKRAAGVAAELVSGASDAQP